jgi:hypothetical protein
VATEKQRDKGEVHQLKLTPDQRAAIRQVTGEQVGEALWLTVQELEERLGPGQGDVII